MKKIKLLAFSLLAFLCFGLINVNAETVTVTTLEEYETEMGKASGYATEVKLGANIDISSLSTTGNNDAIYVDSSRSLDLNGYTLTTGYGKLKLWYYGDYTFTIKDSSASKTGIIKARELADSQEAISLSQINNCNPILKIADVTIRNSDGLSKVGKFIYTRSGSAGFVNNIIIDGTKFLGAMEIFSAREDAEYTKVDIINMSSTKVTYLSSKTGYIVSDVINANSKILIDDNPVDMTKALYNTKASNKIEVGPKESFEVKAPTFVTASFGYLNIPAKPISITTIGSNRQVKSVTVDQPSKFTIIGSSQPTINAGATDNTSFTIKPVNGLGIGTHTATITVTDMDDNTYTATVSFVVDYASVMVATNITELTEYLNGTHPAIDEVRLGGNISLIGDLLIYPTKNITFDLNGYTLDANTKNVSVVYGSKKVSTGNLTIKDSTTTGQIINLKKLYISNNNSITTEKNYGLTIDGGSYFFNDSRELIGFNTDSDYYWDGTTNFDFTINKGIFNGSYHLANLIFASKAKENAKSFNITLNSLTYNNNNGGSLYYGSDSTIDEAVSSQSDVYAYQSGSLALISDRTTNLKDIDSEYGTGSSIKIVKRTGFGVTAPTFDNVTYGYGSVTAKPISITAIDANRQVKSVTVDQPSKFTITGSSQPTINAGATDNTSFTIKPVNGLGAGTHTATITVADIANNIYTATVKIIVNKANINPTISMANWTYGETAPTPVINGNLGSGTETVEYKVSGADDSTYTTTKPSNAGSYTAKLTVGATANYNGASVTDNFEINKKDVNPTVVKIKDKTFDNTDNLEIENIVLNPAVDYTVESIVFAPGYNKYVNLNNNARVFIKLTDEAFKNYTIGGSQTFITPNISFKINPITSTLTEKTSVSHEVVKGSSIDLSTLVDLNPAEYISELTYEINGITPSGVTLSGKTLSVANTISGTPIIVVNITFKGKDLGGSTDLEYSKTVILPINIQVVDKPSQEINETLTTINKTYGDESFTNAVTLKKGNGIITYTSTDTDVATVDNNTGKVTIKKAGTTTIKISVSDTPEFAKTEFTYTLNVDKRALTVNPGSYAMTKVYDGSTSAGTVSGTLEIVGKKSTDDVTVTTSTIPPYTSSNVHNENLTLALTGLSGAQKDNYKLDSTTVSIPASITKKTITPTITIGSVSAYTGSAIEPTITVKDGSTTLNSSQYDLVYNNNVNAGTGTVTVTPKTNGNYTWTAISENFTINKANYTGTPTWNKYVRHSHAYTYEISIDEIGLDASILDGNFVSIEDISNTNGVINTVELSPDKKIKVTVNNVASVDLTDSFNVVINNKNYNDFKFKINITTKEKTIVTIDGLTYTSREYNGNPMTPTGTLTSGSYTGSLDVLYESTDGKGYSSSTAPKNVGEYKVTYSVPSTELNYAGSKVYTFAITKANPVYIVPTDLKGTVGDKLNTVLLPSGFTWDDSTLDLTLGTQTFVATYTPIDLENYNVVTNININVLVENIKYKVIEGANQKYIIDKNTTATFKINGDFALFDNVYVDNVLVDPVNYDAESGSTIITLKEAYLRSLSKGTHTLKVTYTNGGEAITNFTIGTYINNPNTSDTIITSIMLGTISLLGLLGSCIYYRKRNA